MAAYRTCDNPGKSASRRSKCGDSGTEGSRRAKDRAGAGGLVIESAPGARPEHAERRLPEERLRGLFDAFHLELCYDDLARELDLRVTITGDTAAEPGATVQAVLDTPDGASASDYLVADASRARGGSRTRTPFWGSRF